MADSITEQKKEEINKKVKEATDKDKGHTKEFCESEN